MRRFLVITGGVLLATCGIAAAQSRSSGNSSSSFGSSSFGSSSMGASSSSRGFSGQVGNLGGFRTNNSTFGQSSSLMTGKSSGAMGSDAFGSTRQDPLAMGRASGSSSQSRGGQNSMRNSGMFGGGNSGRNFGNNMNQNMQQNTKRSPMATQISFEVPKLDPKTVVASAQSPLMTKVMPNGVGVKVQVNDGVAILTGNVPTSHDARLAAAIVSLEPGIRGIDNRLVVDSSAPKSGSN